MLCSFSFHLYCQLNCILHYLSIEEKFKVKTHNECYKIALCPIKIYVDWMPNCALFIQSPLDFCGLW